MAQHESALMTGVRGGRTVDLRQIAREGITLLGSLLDTVDGRLHFATDLNANLKAGDESFVQFVKTIDAFIDSAGTAMPREEGFDPYLSEIPDPLREIDILDMRAANITAVVGRQAIASISDGSTARYSTNAAHQRSIGG